MNSEYDADVIIIGAGGGGAVVAKELGEKGLRVLVLEAGPWYGNKKWPKPNEDAGAIGSSSYEDLDINLLNENFTDLEDDMNNLITGKFRWGCANRDESPWRRRIEQGGFAWQSAGVGGSTLLYFANSPRAYPQAFEKEWAISYEELVPYYEKVENTLPVYKAMPAAKEELFYYGAMKAGWQYLEGGDLTSPGYRPQPNAILKINPQLASFEFDIQNNHSVGCTMRGHCVNGCHLGPSVGAVAKRSTLASYIPLALSTGNVEVRPNTFVTRINTQEDETEGLYAASIEYRDTWTGKTGELRARVIVMSAGAIETPRLWLNSNLPENEWVGKGLTNHIIDCLAGVFEEKAIMNAIGIPEVMPYVGQNSAARFDYPGLGTFEPFGVSPGLFSTMLYGTSQKGFAVPDDTNQQPWDLEGLVAGEQLKELMRNYSKTMGIVIFSDDEVNQKNGVTLDLEQRDENGYIPVIAYQVSDEDIAKRDELARIAADILRKAGAKIITRANWPFEVYAHIMSTMRMGYVTDTNCEAYQVKRLFIADNSVLCNGLGGPNPTLTTQALATRTSEKIFEKYFGGASNK